MQANQKIALLNFKKIIDEKNNFMNSQDFIDYMNKKQEFKNIVETTLKHDEFDKYTKLLEELKDPVEAYDKKLVALVNKFDGYKALIEECERKLEECKSAGKSDFDEIVRFRNNSLSVKKSNPIMSFVSKILNILTGNKKFEKEVILKMQKELKDVEESNNTNISAISDQTILLVSKIQEVRNALNKEFKIATE